MESSFKKGGVRQRADEAQSPLGNVPTGKKRRQAAENEVMQSALAQFLIMQWAWGYMSPQDVQRISHLAREDIMRLTGSNHTLPDIDILASIGTDGRYPRNMNRDLQAKYGVNRLSKPLTTQMPMMTLSQEFVAAADQNIFLPHVLFSDLYNHYPNAWRDRICPSMEKLNEFWSEMEGCPQLRDHPITQLENYQSRAIPLSIHGDGVPVTGVGKTWGKSIDAFSWCSLLGVGLTIECNFLFGLSFRNCVAARRSSIPKQDFGGFLFGACRFCKRDCGQISIGMAIGTLEVAPPWLGLSARTSWVCYGFSAVIWIISARRCSSRTVRGTIIRAAFVLAMLLEL